MHVKPSALNTIAAQYTVDSHGACTKMLHAWLTGCTMSNDMRKSTLRELAITIGASCGGAHSIAAKKIFEKHGDGETYDSELKNLREHAETVDGKKYNDWAFIEHLIRIYFSSTENFPDRDAVGKRFNPEHAPNAALPFLFAGLYPCVSSQSTLLCMGLQLSIPFTEAEKITQQSSRVSVNELSVILFELLYHALQHQPKALKWAVICRTLSPRAAVLMQKAITANFLK